ncbi:hypothetical protein K435DRAFT_790426, partial [Dendrothele bispora CBS 962.96]
NNKSPLRQSFKNLVGLVKKAQDRVKRSHHKDLPSLVVQTPHAVPSILDADKVLLSWSSVDNNPDSLVIDLKRCTDVRSLSSAQINPEEMSLLPDSGHNTDIKLFEIVMSDNSREKFAATSNHERASWVSAIWDVVLLLQDMKSIHRAQSIKSGIAQPVTPSSHSPKPQSNTQERNLPAIPSESSTKENLGLSKPTISRDLLHSTPHTLCSTPTTPSDSPKYSQCISSPSITNLNHRSMVRQRLAEMERGLTGTCEKSPSNVPSVVCHLDPPSRTELPPSESTESANDSLLDAYTEVPSITQIRREDPARVTSGQSHRMHAIPEDAREGCTHDERFTLKITALQQEVQTLNCNLSRFFQSRGPLESESVCKSLAIIDKRVEDTSYRLDFISSNLGAITERLATTPAAPSTQAIIEPIEAIRNTLVPEVTAMSKKMDEIVGQIACFPKNNANLTNNEAQLTSIEALLAEESNQRALHGQQQADSVRYLNELNSWLESFVQNGTSQIQAMAATLQQICEMLGVAQGNPGQATGLLADVRRIVQFVENKELGKDFGNSGPNSGTRRSTFDICYVSSQDLLDSMVQLRREQENLLKMMTAGEVFAHTAVTRSNREVGLSSEIKGERLRFVDAMKEATAINIHNHVEEFKKQLKCEVQGMTQELSRLYRDKQMLENQIADLLDFKRKAAGGGMVVPAQNIRHMQQPFNYSPSHPHLRR